MQSASAAATSTHTATPSAPDPHTQQRISLLLLGDSRDRLLYGQTVARWCTGIVGVPCKGMSRQNGTGAAHCYSWQWAAPGFFPIASYHQTAGGALCNRSQQAMPLAAYGYMIVYGVSPVPPYLHDWSTHPHANWSGLGWMDGSADGERPRVNSAALAVEAAWRFASRAPPDSCVVVVYSSLLWDLGRRVELYPHQHVYDWAAEYRSNYSRVVSAIGAALALRDTLRAPAPHAGSATTRSVLALSTPFYVDPRWKFYEPRANATVRLAELAASHVRATAAAHGLPLVDWQTRFREAPPAGEADKNALTDPLSHPGPRGVSLAWSEVTKTLASTFQLPL